MQEPIDSSGELMKDRRYGTGLREQKEPILGSAEYWYAQYVREREAHMQRSGAWAHGSTVRGWRHAVLENPPSINAAAMLNLRSALNETEGSDE